MSFKKKLGNILKVAAPIAAMAIPGLGPIASMALGGIGAGVGEGLSGGSLKDDLLAGGLGALPGAAKGAKGPLGTVLKTATGVLHGGQPGSNGDSTDANGNSMWDDLIGAGGTAIDAYGKSAANNRGAEASIDMDTQKINNDAANSYANQVIARRNADRTSQDDAWKKVQQTSYVANSKGSPGGEFSPFTRAIAAPSDDVKAAANALMGQTRDALMSGEFNTNGGAPLPLPVDRSNFSLPGNVIHPGTGEQIANVAGPALNMWSALTRKKPNVIMNTQKA